VLVAQLLILTPAADDDVLPALSLLTHRVRVIPASPDQLVRAPDADLVFLDARTNLAGAKALSQILRTTGLSVPLLLVVTEGGLTAVTPDWGIDDVVLEHAGPAEVDARIRLACARRRASRPSASRPRASSSTRRATRRRFTDARST
jgi:DNA-binding response OmpR family regulator